MGQSKGLSAVLIACYLCYDLGGNIAGRVKGMRLLDHGFTDNSSILQHVLQINQIAVVLSLSKIIGIVKMDNAFSMCPDDFLRQKQTHGQILADFAGHVVSLGGIDDWIFIGVFLLDFLIHPINQGYYPHVQEEREKRSAQGSAAIWDIFAEDPRTRVIALGEHPGVLSFPCWVQSYVDISGYWGNPEVVADAPGFLRYLQYANVDYLYMEREYVDTSVRIYQIIRSLIQEGWLCDVRDENGNLVLSVCRDDTGHTKEETARNLWVFDERYIQHP